MIEFHENMLWLHNKKLCPTLGHAKFLDHTLIKMPHPEVTGTFFICITCFNKVSVCRIGSKGWDIRGCHTLFIYWNNLTAQEDYDMYDRFIGMSNDDHINFMYEYDRYTFEFFNPSLDYLDWDTTWFNLLGHFKYRYSLKIEKD